MGYFLSIRDMGEVIADLTSRSFDHTWVLDDIRPRPSFERYRELFVQYVDLLDTEERSDVEEAALEASLVAIDALQLCVAGRPIHDFIFRGARCEYRFL